MSIRSHLRPGATTLVVLFLALAGIAAFWAEPAPAVTTTAGPATVTVTDNGNVTDGQAAHIRVQANTGAVYEIRAHLCAAGANISTTLDFSYDGAYCTPSPVSGGSDAETILANGSGLPGGKGDLAFRIGAGTGKQWTDYWGATHTLTCGPQSPCALVVQLQVTDNTFFATLPICYGAPCAKGAESPGPDATQPSSATPTSTAAPATPTGAKGASAAGGGSAGTKVQGAATAKTHKVTDVELTAGSTAARITTGKQTTSNLFRATDVAGTVSGSSSGVAAGATVASMTDAAHVTLSKPATKTTKRATLTITPRPGTASATGAGGSVSGTATPAATAAGGSGSSRAPGPAGSGGSSAGPAAHHQSGISSFMTTLFGRVSAHQAIRTIAAGIAGIIGGILLALIGSRARRQMMGTPT